MPRSRFRRRGEYKPHNRQVVISYVTQHTVHGACDALVREGAKVSVRNVRDRMGGGSFRDLTPHIRSWREKHRASEVARGDAGFDAKANRPGAGAQVSAPIELTKIRAEVEQARNETRALKELLTKQLAADFADLRQRFGVENEALKTELQIARAERDAARRSLATTQARLKRARVASPPRPQRARGTKRAPARPSGTTTRAATRGGRIGTRARKPGSRSARPSKRRTRK